jgi:hypothetical protein
MGVLWFDSRRVLGIFLFTTASRTALGPTQPPIQWVPLALSPGRVKRPGYEANHLPPSNAEVKEWVELYLHSSNPSLWRGAYLKHRDNFNLLSPDKWRVTTVSFQFPIFPQFVINSLSHSTLCNVCSQRESRNNRRLNLSIRDSTMKILPEIRVTAEGQTLTTSRSHVQGWVQ